MQDLADVTLTGTVSSDEHRFPLVWSNKRSRSSGLSLSFSSCSLVSLTSIS